MEDPECAREFLSRGADPSRVDSRGAPTFLTAIHCLREDDTILLDLFHLEYGARLKSEHLYYAVGRRVAGSQFKTSFLRENGLDPNASHPRWGTLLHCAIFAGADPTARSQGTNFHGQTPSEAAEWLQNPDTKSAILSLLHSAISAKERDASS